MLRSHLWPTSRPYLLPFLMLLLILWPLVGITYPPLVDYYSHLARVHITANSGDFSAFYAATQNIPPNVAFDAITGALLKAVPIEIAGWIFIVSTLVLQASGLWILNRKLLGPQAVPVGPLLGYGILYNTILSMGYLSFLFGLGLALWMIWMWLVVRDRTWWIALGVAGGATLLLYFSHIVAFGIYGLAIGGYELQQFLSDRRTPLAKRSLAMFKGGLPFLPPVLFYVTGFQGSAQSAQFAQDFLREKSFVLAGAFNTGTLPLALNIAGLAFLAALALALGRVRFSTVMVLPISLLTLLFLISPTNFTLVEYDFASGFDIDDRLPLAIMLLVCSSVRVDFPARWRSVTAITALALFLAAQSITLSRDFARFEADVRQSLRLFDSIEPHSVVAVAIDTTHPEYSWSARGRANWHVAALAALHGPVFVATTHARAGQHTMSLSGPPYSDIYAWQRELPKEVASAWQLRDVISEYSGVAAEVPLRDSGAARNAYLLLMMPHTVLEVAESAGTIIGQSNWFALIDLNSHAANQN